MIRRVDGHPAVPTPQRAAAARTPAPAFSSVLARARDAADPRTPAATAARPTPDARPTARAGADPRRVQRLETARPPAARDATDARVRDATDPRVRDAADPRVRDAADARAQSPVDARHGHRGRETSPARARDTDARARDTDPRARDADARARDADASARDAEASPRTSDPRPDPRPHERPRTGATDQDGAAPADPHATPAGDDAVAAGAAGGPDRAMTGATAGAPDAGAATAAPAAHAATAGAVVSMVAAAPADPQTAAAATGAGSTEAAIAEVGGAAATERRRDPSGDATAPPTLAAIPAPPAKAHLAARADTPPGASAVAHWADVDLAGDDIRSGVLTPARARIVVGDGPDRAALVVTVAHNQVTVRATAPEPLAAALQRAAGELNAALHRHGLSLGDLSSGDAGERHREPPPSGGRTANRRTATASATARDRTDSNPAAPAAPVVAIA